MAGTLRILLRASLWASCSFPWFFSPATAATPAVVAHFGDASSGRAKDFVTEESYGYLVTEQGSAPELRILDVRDPRIPTMTGDLDFPGDLNAIVVRDGLAYLATSINERQVAIVDVSNSTSPQILAGVDLGPVEDAISLEIGGPFLFVGTKRGSGPSRHELVVIDISNPVAPVLLRSLEVGGHVYDLALRDDVLYAATSHNAKEVIAFDVSVPAAIFEVESVDLPGSANAQGLAVHRGLVYVTRRTHRDNFFVLDANTLTQVSATRLTGRGEKVKVYRDRAYVASHGSRSALQVVDVGDPSEPLIAHRIGNASTSQVHISPPYTYVTTRKRGEELLVIDTEALLRPNIVLVLTDDQHLASVDFMPALQELASRGLTFRQSFVTTPVCGPSRSSLLTGLYTHNHGALLNTSYIGNGTGATGSDESTIATWLQSAGYRTGFIGKYVNAYKHQCVDGSCQVPPGWDDWQGVAAGGPGNVYYNYAISNNGTLEQFGDQPQDYSTDVLAQKTLDFLQQEDGRPFFAVLSVNAPHLDTGLTVPPAPRHAGAFAGIPPWRPASYDEEDMSDKPSIIAQRPRADDLVVPAFTWGQWTDFHRQEQLEALLSVDEAIDEIVAALGHLGELDDTVIIFTSDNGYHWGELRAWGGKIFPDEGSIRVPLIFSYPRLIAPGREDTTHIVLNIDLAPTIAALSDRAPDGPVDGQSLVPLLKGEVAPDWRTDFLVEQYGGFQLTDATAYQGIRDGSGMYAYYFNLGEEELYDLDMDPDQMDSQALNPAYEPLKSHYRNRINRLMTNNALRF